MQPVPQDLLKGYVQSQHFTSTTEIMEAMKEMFRDVIQTVMEVEMDEELGRERCERSDEPEGAPRNYRNGCGVGAVSRGYSSKGRIWVVVQRRTVPGNSAARRRSKLVLPPLPMTAVTPGYTSSSLEKSIIHLFLFGLSAILRACFTYRLTIRRFMPCSKPSAERSNMGNILANCRWVKVQKS